MGKKSHSKKQINYESEAAPTPKCCSPGLQSKKSPKPSHTHTHSDSDTSDSMAISATIGEDNNPQAGTQRANAMTDETDNNCGGTYNNSHTIHQQKGTVQNYLHRNVPTSSQSHHPNQGYGETSSLEWWIVFVLILIISFGTRMHRIEWPEHVW